MRTLTLMLALAFFTCLPAVELPVTGTTITGEKQSIDPIQRGRPVLVVFWASWCGVCVREIPAIKNFQTTASASIDVISCTIDTDADAAKACATKHQLNYPVILDSDMAIADRFTVDGTPTLILIGKDGHECARGRSLGQLRESLAKLGIIKP